MIEKLAFVDNPSEDEGDIQQGWVAVYFARDPYNGDSVGIRRLSAIHADRTKVEAEAAHLDRAGYHVAALVNMIYQDGDYIADYDPDRQKKIREKAAAERLAYEREMREREEGRRRLERGIQNIRIEPARVAVDADNWWAFDNAQGIAGQMNDALNRVIAEQAEMAARAARVGARAIYHEEPRARADELVRVVAPDRNGKVKPAYARMAEEHQRRGGLRSRPLAHGYSGKGRR